MPEEIEILKLICGRLEAAEIPYMLTGSLAANFYAIPRMTRDIDFVIEILNSKIDTFFEIFQSDFYVDKSALADAVNQQHMFNIIHNRLIFKVDFIIRKDSVYRDTEFQRRIRVKFDDAFIWIVSPEDLIISKLIWAKDSLSELQLKDVKNLLLSINNLDKDYLWDWVQKLKLVSVYDKVQVNG